MSVGLPELEAPEETGAEDTVPNVPFCFPPSSLLRLPILQPHELANTPFPLSGVVFGRSGALGGGMESELCSWPGDRGFLGQVRFKALQAQTSQALLYLQNRSLCKTVLKIIRG